MNPSRIRNISIIGSDQHGKTSLLNRILGSINDEDNIIPVNTNYVMTERSNPISISTKSSSISDELLLNIIDTPGHPEFLGQIPKDLKLTDGLIIVVDCTEGLFEHLRAILKHSLSPPHRARSYARIVDNKNEPFKNIVLFINKIDLLFKLDAGMYDDFEAIYKTLKKIISDVNEILQEYKYSPLDPREGNVILGSALHGWVIDFAYFANEYHKSFDIDQDKLLGKLWGDHFYDENEKKWRKRLKNGNEYRSFNKFVLLPIHRAFQQAYLLAMSLSLSLEPDVNDKNDEYEKNSNNDTQNFKVERQNDSLPKCINSILKPSKHEIKPEVVLELRRQYRLDTMGAAIALLHLIMRQRIPLRSHLINIIDRQLPSPVQAQNHSYNCFHNKTYKSTEDIEEEAIYNCDPNGPLIIHVTKYVEIDSTIMEKHCRHINTVYLGRIFSGAISNNGNEDAIAVNISGELSSITRNDSIKGVISLDKKQSLYPVTRNPMTCNNNNDNSNSNNKIYDVLPFSAGCLVLLVMERHIWNPPAVLTLKKEIRCSYSIIPCNDPILLTPPVMEVPIYIDSQYACFVNKGLQILRQTDLSFCFWEGDEFPETTGKILLFVTGKHHLRTSVASLINISRQEQQKKQEDAASSEALEIKVMEDDNIVCYHETVTSTSPHILAKSPNRYNRITMYVQPVDQSLDDKKDIVSSVDKENNTTDVRAIRNKRRKQLARSWHDTNIYHNLLYNDTSGIQYVFEYMDGIRIAFNWVLKNGPLFEGPLSHCQFHIHDIFSNCDTIKRGNSQVIPMARHAIFGSLVNANMTLEEPIYIVEIICKAAMVQHVRNFFLMTVENNDAYGDSSKQQQYQNCVFIDQVEQCDFMGTVRITLHIPVKDAMSLDKEELNKNPLIKIEALRKIVHHWERLPGLAYDPDSKVHQLVRELRKRRGLPEDIPTFDQKYERKT